MPRTTTRSSRAAEPDLATELALFGEVGWDIDPRAVLAELRATNGGPIKVMLDSPGGDAFAGLSLYQALRDHPGHVEVVITGLAASAASVIAMAGNTVTVSEHAMIMIHDAWTITAGDERDHLAAAGLLGKVSNVISEVYASRTGESAATWRERMRGEVWFTAAEAVEAGLADRVVTPPAARLRQPAPRRPRTVSGGELAATVRAAVRPRPDPGKALSALLVRALTDRPMPSVAPLLRQARP